MAPIKSTHLYTWEFSQGEGEEGGGKAAGDEESRVWPPKAALSPLQF